jgi:hypothetical protein
VLLSFRVERPALNTDTNKERKKTPMPPDKLSETVHENGAKCLGPKHPQNQKIRNEPKNDLTRAESMRSSLPKPAIPPAVKIRAHFGLPPSTNDSQQHQIQKLRNEPEEALTPTKSARWRAAKPATDSQVPPPRQTQTQKTPNEPKKALTPTQSTTSGHRKDTAATA